MRIGEARRGCSGGLGEVGAGGPRCWRQVQRGGTQTTAGRAGVVYSTQQRRADRAEGQKRAIEAAKGGPRSFEARRLVGVSLCRLVELGGWNLLAATIC
jgi:hypothetical protein